MRNRFCIVGALIAAAVVAVAPPAGAPHLYRNDGGGCAPNEGALGAEVEPAANIRMLHNTFADAATMLPITQISAGDAIRWTWDSSHCHSATAVSDVSAGTFDTGFFYPTTPPDSPQAVPGFFEYPVFDPEPKLSYTQVFPEAGTYVYNCVHHFTIGMWGVVVVQ